MTTRRLAAILAADVVGYSRMMAADEAATLARLRALRTDVVDPLMAAHGGRVFKTAGDGLLAEFPSVVEALRCAIAIQEQMRARADDTMQLRIGLHQGDVVIDGDDLLGDGINIAARLEPLAEPGGIAISARVREDAAGKMPLDVEDLGTPALKNIDKPIHVFRVRLDVLPRPALALPEKPSLAVLPFQNMSGDQEQEYFADGMVEDITTALSRTGWLFVIARNSAFTYKGRAVDVRQVGRELGVRYVLEGSVRKAGGRVRITCQLIESTTGHHVWADRFDGELADVFDLQDRITAAIVGAIEPSLRGVEIERALDKPTDRLDAYDLLLRARFHLYQNRKSDGETALRLAREAVALDPRFAQGKALVAWTIAWGTNAGWWHRASELAADGIACARAALAVTANDPVVLCEAGFALGYQACDNIAGRIALNRALALNPNSAQALTFSAWLWAYASNWRQAHGEFIRAQRLSPRDPHLPFILVGQGVALVELGEAETALEVIQQGISVGHGQSYGRNALIHCLVTLGRTDEARAIAQAILAANPSFTVTDHHLNAVMFESAYLERRLASLRTAGIPE